MVTRESFSTREGERREWLRSGQTRTGTTLLQGQARVPEPRMPLPKGKDFVRKVPAWGEKSAMGGRGPARGVKPVRPVLKPVRSVWRQQGDQFGFRARDESRFVAGGRGSGGWPGELAGGEFAGRSPPRDQYEFGRDRSFESQRGYGPYFSYHGSRTPPMRREWFSHGRSRFDSFDRMDRSFDRCGRIDVANPTFEEMARH
jgi:hypothetical protein